MNKEIVPTTKDHILELAETMRKADRDEIWASSRLRPYEALRLGVAMSEEPLTGLLNGKVVCIFGISKPSVISDKASPWLLASDLLPRVAITFLRLNKVYMDEVKKRYKFLENYVDCRNVEAIKWLKWLGFKMSMPHPYGPDELLFSRFELRRD